MDLNKIAAGLRLIADGMESAGNWPSEAPKEPVPAAESNVVAHPTTFSYSPPPQEPAVQQQTAVQPQPAVQPQMQTYSLEAIKAQLQRFAQIHGNDGVIAILREFGVDRVSNLPPEQYANIMTRIGGVQ